VRLIKRSDLQTSVPEEIIELLFFNNYSLETLSVLLPVPVAAWYKSWVCGSSLAEIVGLNPAGGMDVSLLWVLYVVR